MPRFDVHAFDHASSLVPFVVNIQADILADLNTRVVIPLVLANNQGPGDLDIKRLKPVLTINDQTYILVTTDIGTVQKAQLGSVIINLSHESDTILQSIDLLISGF